MNKLYDEWLAGLRVGDRLSGLLCQCGCCGEKFIGQRNTSIYCGPKCQKRDQYLRRKAAAERKK